ncbi:unnamed protein product [Ectocarpus fasciculatus]
MKLGSLVLKSRAILSPLESVSDVGFRSLCGELGAGITWTEMIRAQALAKGNRSAMDLIDTFDNSSAYPTGIQLLAKTPSDLHYALEQLETSASDGTRPYYSNAVAIDLNFGCPSPSILREGAGPALLKRRKRLAELFSILVDWRNSTSLPIGAIGCKIRLGLNQSEVNNKLYLSATDIAVECGLDYLTVHARHAAQRSSIPSNWIAIAEVKERVKDKNISIIGNGDVYTAADAVRMRTTTGCDGVMIARGAIKNPWVFRDLVGNSLFNGNKEIERAETFYFECALRRDTKPKYPDFHKGNFNRLKQIADPGTSGTAPIPFSVPKNQHIS